MGKVNATLPKDVEPETVTMELAVELIAAKGGGKATKKPAVKKPAAKKKPATKKPAAKKAAAKKQPADGTEITG